MVRFRVIFFNAGGTLLQLKDTTLPILYSQLLTRIFEKDVSPEKVYLAFKKADSWVLSRKKPGAMFTDLDQRKYQNTFYAQLGITNRKEINRIERQVAEQLDYDFVLENGAKKLLRQLKSQYKLGLISNWDESLIEILQDLQIFDFFDSITLSSDIGVNKPDLEIFRSALDDFPEIRPKETVYIGDDFTSDIIPAQTLGIFAILFDKGPTGMHGKPFHTDVKSIKIKEMIELPNILKKYEIIGYSEISRDF